MRDLKAVKLSTNRLLFETGEGFQYVAVDTILVVHDPFLTGG